MISAQDALSLLKLEFSALERRTMQKLEATIDSSLAKSYSQGATVGGPIKFDCQESVEPKVAYEIARRYEEFGWRVSVLSVSPLTFVFMPNVTASAPVVEKKELPPLGVLAATPAAVAAPGTKRLLVRMATRGRPIQAIDVLTKYRDMAGVPVTLEVVFDEDDETMHAGDVIQRLHALGCVITVGAHKSKIEAMNAGRTHDWDVILSASDDQVPVMQGYGKLILDEMEKHFPHLDGGIYFDDGHQGENCCTLTIMGRRLYEQFGYIYYPGYKSLFCDAEYTDLCLAMGRLVYVDKKPIEHRHPSWGLAKPDKLYAKNEADWDFDETLYRTRKELRREGAQFAFDSPPLWLSIGILTIPSRREMLERLVDHLYAQILRDAPRECEIIVDSGDGNMGAKRQRVLEKAKGHYVVFVDDDDWVAHDYVLRTIDALKETPNADCASLVGVMTTAGTCPERFEHSIAHTENITRDGVHYRSPRQINTIRTDLARKVGYKDVHYVDDQDFCERVRPLLKVEADTGRDPLYFYFFDPNGSQKIRDHAGGQ